MAFLQRYLATADYRDRKRVAEAEGESEILASRVFRAFDRYVQGSGVFGTVDAARAELLRNPSLTLTFLRPIADEELVEEAQYGGSMPPVGYEYAEAYIGLCVEIGRAKELGQATSVLIELAEHNDSRVAERARSALLYLHENNVMTVGRRYRARQSEEDLQWMAAYYLERGMARPRVEEHLGAGVMTSSYTALYDSKGPLGPGSTLRCEYYDGRLNTWDWDGKDSPVPGN